MVGDSGPSEKVVCTVHVCSIRGPKGSMIKAYSVCLPVQIFVLTMRGSSSHNSAPYLAGVLGVPEHPRNLGVQERGKA